MSFFPFHGIEDVLQSYGYAGVGIALMLESMGAPLPGESLMIAAAIYAATTGKMDIWILVPVAAAGAILGDQVGYLIGRWIGFRVLARWGRRIGISDERMQLGRYLFQRYGGGVVFLGRFVAFLRTVAAVLAGANRMPWTRFLLWNGLGGIVWTAGYGFGAYVLGDAFTRLHGPAGIALGVAGAAMAVVAVWFVKKNETRLLEDARREMGAAQPVPVRVR
ncbi:MAG: DedA family protein [Acetobacteraceae bacterium]